MIVNVQSHFHHNLHMTILASMIVHKPRVLINRMIVNAVLSFHLSSDSQGFNNALQEFPLWNALLLKGLGSFLIEVITYFNLR